MGVGEDLLIILKRIEAKIDALGTGASSTPRVAPDAEIDDPKYGDEEIRKDPPRWTGSESFAGKRMSECSPDFLECFAEFKDYCASRDEQSAEEKKKKNAFYDRKRAAKARGWAARLRAGWKPPVREELPEEGWQ